MASSSTSGQSYTFSLKLRYGGRISLCNPPKYLGGKVTTFSDMDSDEWGIMTLREKVVELGFNKDDNLRYFSLVDPLLTVGDNIIANSLTNAQNMTVDTSQMEIIPSSQLQFQEMDNTSHHQQEQKSTKRKHKSKETKSLGLTKSRTTVAKTYRTRSSNIMKFKNDKSSAIELD
nr:uncharacterized protein LOC109149242 [Ipomoea batatas]